MHENAEQLSAAALPSVIAKLIDAYECDWVYFVDWRLLLELGQYFLLQPGM